ncbi:hypothetical protein Tco_1465418 [Tanacetum coccineum]
MLRREKTTREVKQLLTAEGTFLLASPDQFIHHSGKPVFKILDLVKSETLLEVLIEYSSVQQPKNNPVIFYRSSFSSVGKQLAKSCEAKSLDSLGFKEVTRSSISWLMSRYEGLAFIEATSASAFAFACSSSSFRD